MPTGSLHQPIRVIVTASSILLARQLKRDLASDANLEVATAATAAELFDSIALNRPSVIVLDTQLSGETTPLTVQGLVHQRQIPVIVYARDNENPGMLLDAIDQGALAVVWKPTSTGQTAELMPNLIWTLRAAAGASIANLMARPQFSPVSSAATTAAFALAGGMGALPALNGVLSQLPADAPGTVVISGLNRNLTGAWVERLAPRCAMNMKHAVDGDAIRPGQILVAPGDHHMLVRRGNGGLTVSIKAGPAVFHQMPSIELLFNSLADTAGPTAIAALLSGAGVDGVSGLLSLRKAGGQTIAQSPQSSICRELPTRAQRCGGAICVANVEEIAQTLLEFASHAQLHRAA